MADDQYIGGFHDQVAKCSRDRSDLGLGLFLIGFGRSTIEVDFLTDLLNGYLITTSGDRQIDQFAG